MPETRTEQLASLAQLKSEAEAAYDKMYDVYTDNDIRTQFDLAEDRLFAASRLAKELGMQEESAAIDARYQHIRTVYRHQFRRPT